MLTRKTLASLHEIAGYSDQEIVELGLDYAISAINQSIEYKPAKVTETALWNNMTIALSRVYSNTDRLVSGFSFLEYGQTIRHLSKKTDNPMIAYVGHVIILRVLSLWSYDVGNSCTLDSLEELRSKAEHVQNLFEDLMKDASPVDARALEKTKRTFFKNFQDLVLQRAVKDLATVPLIHKTDYFDSLLKSLQHWPYHEFVTKIHNELFAFLLHDTDTQKNLFTENTLDIYIAAMLHVSEKAFFSDDEKCALINTLLFHYKRQGEPITINTPQLNTLSKALQVVEEVTSHSNTRSRNLWSYIFKLQETIAHILDLGTKSVA